MDRANDVALVNSYRNLTADWWQVIFRSTHDSLDCVPLKQDNDPLERRDGVAYVASTPERPMRRVVPDWDSERRWAYAGYLHAFGVMALYFYDRLAPARTSLDHGVSNGSITVVLDSPFHFAGQYLRLAVPWQGVRARGLSWWRLPFEPGSEEPLPPLESTRPLVFNVIRALAEAAGPEVEDTLRNVLKRGEELVVGSIKDTRRAHQKLNGPGLGVPQLVGPILEAAGRLSDVLRFSVKIPPSSYSRRVREIVEELMFAGQRVARVRLAWEPVGIAGYRGCNVVLCTPVSDHGGLRYEVQLHTPDSFRVTAETHGRYEERRKPSTAPIRKHELDLESELIFVRGVPVPPGIGELRDWAEGVAT